ncbi:MAG: hypothetical protein Hyperionvirus2_53 [Hyperionvirus sp.]|uniref:Uncharacterized protein n=1 Tax=Hyperionvirus sp. TaxID=2487770 RepID=A0A3G5A608_9VIRU|nr:MAG: hypothetical protein Hyperionvirus2_53 [Hyperionvirus sp.]
MLRGHFGKLVGAKLCGLCRIGVHYRRSCRGDRVDETYGTGGQGFRCS